MNLKRTLPLKKNVQDGWDEELVFLIRDSLTRLSERDAEILSLYAQGYSFREIAARLKVSNSTIYEALDNIKKMLF